VFITTFAVTGATDRDVTAHLKGSHLNPTSDIEAAS
jgi:hypothetical protein